MSLYSQAQIKNPLERLQTGSAEERWALVFRIAFLFLALTSILGLLLVITAYVRDIQDTLHSSIVYFNMENVEAKMLLRVLMTIVFVSLMWIARRGKNRTILWGLLVAALIEFAYFGAFVMWFEVAKSPIWTEPTRELFAWWAVAVSGQGAPLNLVEIPLSYSRMDVRVYYLLEVPARSIYLLVNHPSKVPALSTMGILLLAQQTLLIAFYIFALVKQPFAAATRSETG